jgi:uncharacterized membrane protein YedE/YeeE
VRGALLQLGFGGLFGAVLARNGAADFDTMERMFLFEDSHLFAVAAVSTASAALGLFLLRRSPWFSGVRTPVRPLQRGSVLGGLVFGVGWGVSGTCPGTALAQLGSGHLVALITIFGIVTGTWLYSKMGLSRFGFPRDGCK